MKKILLPTDFSRNAYNACEYAMKLFTDEECVFYLVHTYTPVVYQPEYMLGNPGQIPLGDEYQANALMQLEELQATLTTQFNNPKHLFVPHASFNLLVNEVLQLVENENADLVVMGTKGATGAKEILLGTQTVHLIKKVTCPVIAIPSGFEYETPKEILFPTDYEVDYEKEQLQELLDIAKKHISSIEVMHVSTGNELTEEQVENQQKLNYLLAETAHLFHDLPSQGIIDAINNFQLKKRMNLLVMIKNKHTFFERLFIEPVIKKIGFHITIPFMVIPEPKK
ncbi:universal stress protein [Maribacter sp. 2307UL18-2]|uniref:universal stress protein n=1 Tax=Maribacter sp. 2307UL18-2 TaxID=3386274 RepID=UPI0039BD4DF4